MKRVWASNAASTPPAKPANLEEGFPRASGAGTVPGYYWFYMITESLTRLVTSAGLTPSDDDMDQLIQAVEIIAKRNSVAGSLKPVMCMDNVGVPLSGTQTVDGRVMADGERVLRAAGNSALNGIYVVNTAGAWTRAADFANGASITDGSIVEINTGTQFGNRIVILNADPVVREIVVGTHTFGVVDITTMVTTQFNNYLLIADAASTYLTQSAAASTYAAKTEIADMLTNNSANNTYLRKTDAANTYATTASLSGYLSKTEAASVYLTNTAAANTYLTAATANNAYISRGSVSQQTFGYYHINGGLHMVRDKPWFGTGLNDQIAQIFLLTSSNGIAIGDVENVFPGSTMSVRGKVGVNLQVNGTTMLNALADGLHAPVAVPGADNSDKLITSAWVRALVQNIAGSTTNSINVGGYIIKFGVINSSNSTTMSIWTGDNNMYGYAYTLPIAFPNNLIAAMAVPVVPTPDGSQGGQSNGTPPGTCTTAILRFWHYYASSAAATLYFIAIGN